MPVFHPPREAQLLIVGSGPPLSIFMTAVPQTSGPRRTTARPRMLKSRWRWVTPFGVIPRQRHALGRPVFTGTPPPLSRICRNSLDHLLTGEPVRGETHLTRPPRPPKISGAVAPPCEISYSQYRRERGAVQRICCPSHVLNGVTGSFLPARPSPMHPATRESLPRTG